MNDDSGGTADDSAEKLYPVQGESNRKRVIETENEQPNVTSAHPMVSRCWWSLLRAAFEYNHQEQ